MTPLETNSLLGTELAGYRLESVLGRGGMGIVYLADDLRLERKVALKLIAPELAVDSRFRERFLRESRLAASLDHSHVVPVYAAGETAGQLWIAMRYVRGTDLKTLLEQEEPLEPARALALCSQVGEALDAAHAHTLVHRDVKPANVLVTEEDGAEHCYLTDFGLARSPEASDPGGGTHLSGTVDYTAPEQIAHEPADHRADVYSFACVLYECLSGEPPFKRPRAMATLFAHSSEPPPSLREHRPELTEAIDDVIAKALAKDPAERHESCGELCQAAREALGLGGPRFTRRQLLLAGTGAATAVAAAAAVPAILLGSGSEATAPPAILPVTEDSLVRVEPTTGEAIAAIPVAGRPNGVAIDEGAIWVIAYGQQTLSRIDPQQNRIVETVSLSPFPPESIAVGEGAVWTIHANGFLRYDPASGALENIESWATFFPNVVEAGLGAVWLTAIVNNTTPSVLRLDPATGAIAASIPVDYPPGDLRSPWVAVGEGAVWAASQHGLISYIDPATNQVTSTLQVSDALDGIAVAEEAVWVINASDDLVLRIDPATLQVTDRVRVGRTPTALAAGEGAVWVTSERDGTLSRIDSSTFDVDVIDIGGAATDVAADESGVWVAVDVR